MVRRCGLLILAMVTLGAMCFAQESDKKASADAARAEKSAWSFYKLDLTVREMDGTKVVNSRTYTITQRSGDWGQLRVGSRVPVVTGVVGSTAADAKDRLSQFQYIDIGLNLDSRIQERDEALAFDWRMELSSVAAEPGAAGQPVIRQLRNNGQTLLSLGKPVTMTVADDLSSTHKFVFEVTATKLK